MRSVEILPKNAFILNDLFAKLQPSFNVVVQFRCIRENNGPITRFYSCTWCAMRGAHEMVHIDHRSHANAHQYSSSVLAIVRVGP